MKKNPKDHTIKIVEGVNLVHFKNKIYVPPMLQKRIVAWYHKYLAHPGQTRTEATIRQQFYWPNLRQHLEQYCKTCRQCQLCKKQRKKYGHLPPKEAEIIPWERVHIDLIGPYSIQSESKIRTLQCLTMIDPTFRDSTEIVSGTGKLVQIFVNLFLVEIRSTRYGFSESAIAATMTTSSTNRNGDTKMPHDQPSADDDLSVSTPLTGQRPKSIRKEMTIKFEIPFVANVPQPDVARRHSAVLSSIQSAFANDIDIFDNKGRKMSTKHISSLSESTNHKHHFKIHNLPSRGKRTGKSVICHRLHTEVSLTTIKNHYEVQQSLHQYKMYMRSHSWTENDVDIVSLGWILGSQPDSMDTEVHAQILSRQSEKCSMPIPTEKIRIVFTTPSLQIDNNRKINTKAYEVQCKKEDAKEIDWLMKKFTSLTSNVTKHTYVKYRNKYTHPVAYKNAIIKQNKILASTRTIPVIGINEEMMFYISERLNNILGVETICKTRTTESKGRWNIITNMDNFKEVKKKVSQLLTDAIDQDWIPEDALMTRPHEFPLMSVSSGNHWNDESSSEDSYISIFERSVGTDVSNLSDNEANYKYAPSVIPESLSWANVAADNPHGIETTETTTFISPMTEEVRPAIDEDVMTRITQENKNLKEKIVSRDYKKRQSIILIMSSLQQKKLHHYSYTTQRKSHNTSSSSSHRTTPNSLSHQHNSTSTSSLLQQTLLRDNTHLISNQDPVGDHLSDNKSDNTTRFYFLNINGIQLTSTGGDINDICSAMKSSDIDHLFAVEHNLDNTQQQIRHNIQSTIKKYFDHCRGTISGSTIPSKTTFKPGGVLSISRDSYSGRINKTIPDKMGRWIHHSIKGKDNRIINVIACYKVTTSSRPISSQRMTAYSQQYSLLSIQNPSVSPNPRASFDDDLSEVVQNCLQNHQEILLLGDFNEDIEHKSSGLKKIMEKFNLLDIFHQRLGHSNFNTFQSGSSRIDFALSTPLVADAILSCGYDAFSRRIVSDHRGFFIDFDTKVLFGNATSVLAPPIMRGISSNNMSTNREYINLKFEALPDDFVDLVAHLESLTIPHHRLAEKLDQMITNSSLYAEMKCRTRKRPPLPKCILSLRDKYNFYRKCLSEFKTGKTLLKPPHPQGPQWPADKPTTRKECSDCLRNLKKELRESEKAIQISLTDQFDDQLEEYIRTGNKKMETHLRNIRKAKETKSLFSKLNKICKTILRENLNSIRIPVDKPSQPKQAKVWKNIDVPEEITKYLIQRNRNHFGQADGTPFTRPPLSLLLNYQGSTSTAELILEGDYQQEELNDISNLFLSHMQRVTHLDSVRLSITSDDFISKIKTWKESTSTSPSGLHLSHYHALVKKHDLTEDHPEYHELERRRLLLIRAHVALINYAVRFGYSYKRWKKIVNVMILKDPGDTRIHRLRVIHIYEADYNMINALFWRRTIHHCEDHHLLHPGQYGGRPGRSSHDPVIIEELVNEFSRVTRRSNIKFANDAASCYDRILVNLASIFSRKYGCPKTVCLVMASNLQEAKYHLKTGLNVTDDCYQHSALFPIHGSGQGSGNSPAIWTFISCSLFDMHNEVAHGSTFVSFDDTIQVRIHMIGFVDDSTGYCLARPNESYITLLEKMQHDAQCWSDLLHLSGGSLEFQKCLYHLTHYEFLDSGEPFLLPSCSVHNKITLQTFNRDQSTDINLKSNYEDHKTLGYWKSPSGNQNSQIAKLKHKSDSHARVVQSAPLSRREAWTYYFSIYIPSCTYPLPSSHLSEQSLNCIQKEATRSILAKCGYNRNYPRAVVFGPTSFGGLSFRNLYYEQGIQQILLILRHWRSASTIGQLFKVVMSWAQFQVGTSEPLLSFPDTPLPHLESKWIYSLRLALSEFKASIEFDNSMVPLLQRDNDSYIMDHVINSEQFTSKEICKINYCRLYLQAITVSDISSIDGERLDLAFLQGERFAESSYTNSQQVKQAKPNQQSWRLWRKACKLFSNDRYILHQQLGKWHHNAVNLQRCWYSYVSYDNSDLLVRNKTTYDLYHRIPDSNIYSRSTEDPDDLLFSYKYHPVSCKPHIKGYILLNNPGLRNRNPITQRRRTRFFDHISPMPSWKFYLLNGVDMVMPVKYIRQCFQLQNLVVCSDGSVVDDDGSFGWVIANRDGQRLVKCSGPAFGCSSGDSFRAEAYGVLSWMTFFYVFQSHYNIRIPTEREITSQDSPYLEAFTDNEGVIRRIETQMKWKYLSPACTLLPDWDVINQICVTMQDKIPSVTITHVKGHQDDVSLFKDLPLEAQLNVEADELAGAYQQKHSNFNRSSVHRFPSNSAQLDLQGKTITSKYARNLRFGRGHAPLKEYLLQRNSWSLPTYDNVFWDSYSQAIRKTLLPTQFVNKLTHRHLPVAKKVNLYDRHETTSCCFCHTEVETQIHLFQCPHKDLVNLRRTLYQRLRKKCDDLQTDPILRDTLLLGLETFLENKDLVSDNQDIMTNLITDQASIGWSNVLQGHFHKNWAAKYEETLSDVSPKNKLNGTYWTTSIILLIWQWAHEYWKERNTVRTGIENEIYQLKQRAKAEREGKFLYDLKYKICANDRDILATPLEVQLESTTTSLNNWVTVWRPVILQSLSRAITFAITNVLSIKEYFPPLNQ